MRFIASTDPPLNWTGYNVAWIDLYEMSVNEIVPFTCIIVPKVYCMFYVEIYFELFKKTNELPIRFHYRYALVYSIWDCGRFLFGEIRRNYLQLIS